MDILSRIHIFGASGSGTTTLGAALAERLGVLHLDADDFYWKHSDPPFQFKHEPRDRLTAIRARMGSSTQWVLTGSIVSWGETLVDEFTWAIFLELDPELRINRLKQRELTRYGKRIEPGGDMHAAHLEFMEWARAYDTAEQGQRCKSVHLHWMSGLECPVFRMDSTLTIEKMVAEIMDSNVH